MAVKSFSLKNILLGMLLGIIVTAGWAFYPEIEAAVQTQAPRMMAKLSQKAPADSGKGIVVPAEIVQEEIAPPAPEESVAAQTVEVEPAPQAPEETPRADDVTVSTDPMEASPGWNPEVAKALLEPIQALQAAASGGRGRTAAPAADVVSATAVAGLTTPAPVLPETAAIDTLAPVQQEEARWKALFAAPFFPERADEYPFGTCFKKAAADNGIPLAVILGLAAYQSNFDPEVVSDTGFGILNVGWPRPAKTLGIVSKEVLIEDPCANISAGSKYLATLLSQSQDQWVPTLAAYRRHVDPAYLGRSRGEDLNFSQEVRRYVEEVVRSRYQPKTMYAFWEFDELITAKRFMKMVQRQSGVDLWMRQREFGYVIYVPAIDVKEKDRKLQLIEQETGLQAILSQPANTPS